jgi:hypothetical protein
MFKRTTLSKEGDSSNLDSDQATTSINQNFTVMLDPREIEFTFWEKYSNVEVEDGEFLEN